MRVHRFRRQPEALLNNRSASFAEIVALAATLGLVTISFVPYWASLELISNDLVSYGGPTRFSVWEAYPMAVMIGVAICFAIVALGLVGLIAGKRWIRPSVLYVGGGVVAMLLFAYGVFEGPTRLIDDPFYRIGLFGDEPVSFEFRRGPFLYVGLIAAVTIVIGGLFTQRSDDRSRWLRLISPGS